MVLEKEMNHLQTENMKLSSDVKIIRGEQTEILHELNLLKIKNDGIVNENKTLKNIIRGEKEVKGKESNLPLAVVDSPSASRVKIREQQKEFVASQYQNRPESSFQRNETAIQRQSPFVKALEKNQNHKDLKFEDIASNSSPIRPLEEDPNMINQRPPRGTQLFNSAQKPVNSTGGHTTFASGGSAIERYDKHSNSCVQPEAIRSRPNIPLP